MIRTSIPVLCYHNVSQTDGHTPERFAEHLDAILDAGWRTISSRDLLAVVRGERKVPRKSVVLTFDDGHLSNWLTVVPELAKRDMTGTFFALTDFTVDGPVRTLDTAPAMQPMPEAFKAAHLDGDFAQFINRAEYRAMLDQGMEVFSHGCRHQATFRTLRPLARMGEPGARWPAWSIYPGCDPTWPTFDAASGYVYDGFRPVFEGTAGPRLVKRTAAERLALCRDDFTRSFETMRELNGYAEQLFCWPWGQFCDDAEAELKKAGYAGAFTLERWVNARGTDPYRLNRVGVGKAKTGTWVQSRLRMYGSDPTARVFFKLHTKQPEVRRVLYATDSMKLSGGSRQLVNNVMAMRDMGVEPLALLPSESPLRPAVEDLGAEVIPFDRFRDYFHAGNYLKRLVRERAVDVVHTFHNRAYKAGVLARMLGAGCKLFINRGVISRPNDVFFLWTALAHGVICNSAQCAEVLRAHRVMPGRLNVVYNAYAGPDHGEPAPRKKRGTRFIYVGNPAEIKGFDVFLRAAATFCQTGDPRDIEFVGVGIGEGVMDRYQDALTAPVRERLTLTGEIPHAEVLDQLSFADVLCVTSRKESLPNTILEGFDLGLPAVCTTVGGVPELVRDGVNGHLCASEDADCLAAGMRRLADDPATRFRMGLTGRAVVRTLLTPEAKGRNLMRVYMGERLHDPLDVEGVAENLSPDEAPHAPCKH